MTADLADRLGLHVGRRGSTRSPSGGTVKLIVDHVLPRRGVAGYWPIDTRQQSYNVFITPGTIEQARPSRQRRGTQAEPPRTKSWPSPTEAAWRTEGPRTAVVHRRRRSAYRRHRTPASQPVKHDLLDRADKAGASLSQLYFTIGMFAVAAGILLLVNVFVMLADERRSELGILQAVGMRRRTLVAALATEGGCPRCSPVR